MKPRKPLLPQGAKRVFKGVIFDVYQWKQKMFDRSTKTFEMLKRPDTVEVIATRGKKILVCWEKQPGKKPVWCLPGGRMDGDESPLGAAKRELREETGYASLNWKLWLTERPYTKTDWLIYFFIARNCRRVSSQNLDAGERIKVRWITLDQFLKLSDEKTFADRELARHLYPMRLYPQERTKFRKMLFR